MKQFIIHNFFGGSDPHKNMSENEELHSWSPIGWSQTITAVAFPADWLDKFRLLVYQ